MTKKKVLILIGIVLSMIILSGCSKRAIDPKDKELLFTEEYPNIEFNKQIVLEKDIFAPNHEIIGSDVNLKLKNISDQTIEFTPSEGLRIYNYRLSDGQWQSITNKMEYYGPSQFILPQGGNGITDALIPTWPEIYNYHQSITIRFVAIGRIAGGINDGKEVGAYLDVIMKPEDTN